MSVGALADYSVEASPESPVGEPGDGPAVDAAVGSDEAPTDVGNGDGIPSWTSLQLG